MWRQTPHPICPLSVATVRPSSSFPMHPIWWQKIPMSRGIFLWCRCLRLSVAVDEGASLLHHESRRPHVVFSQTLELRCLTHTGVRVRRRQAFEHILHPRPLGAPSPERQHRLSPNFRVELGVGRAFNQLHRSLADAFSLCQRRENGDLLRRFLSPLKERCESPLHAILFHESNGLDGGFTHLGIRGGLEFNSSLKEARIARIGDGKEATL